VGADADETLCMSVKGRRTLLAERDVYGRRRTLDWIHSAGKLAGFGGDL